MVDLFTVMLMIVGFFVLEPFIPVAVLIMGSLVLRVKFIEERLIAWLIESVIELEE